MSRNQNATREPIEYSLCLSRTSSKILDVKLYIQLLDSSCYSCTALALLIQCGHVRGELAGREFEFVSRLGCEGCGDLDQRRDENEALGSG